MKNLTRREFLKVFAPFAAFAAFVLPRPKGDVIAPEVQQDDKTLLAGIERASTKLIDNANFDVAVGEPDVTIFDMLGDFNKTVTTQADAPPGEPLDSLEVLVDPVFDGRFEGIAWMPDNIEPGATVYLSWDKGTSWEYVGKGEIEHTLDSCECAPIEWYVEYKQCEPVEAEYAKCLACGSTSWTWDDEAGGVRCADCGGETIDPRIKKGAR